MFLITDQNNIVVDIATEKENLSRGYTYPNFKQHDNVEPDDFIIGDHYENGTLTKNPQTRIDAIQKAADEQKIQIEIRRAAIERLKIAGELPPDYKEN